MMFPAVTKIFSSIIDFQKIQTPLLSPVRVVHVEIRELAAVHQINLSV